MTDAELLNNSTNEAIQANLIMDQIRDDLLRMAPWNCALKTENLVYITSTPGTPENPSSGTVLWQHGQPSPPWIYEYQYPVDCLRACWIIPSWNTGFSGDAPIYPVVTGYTAQISGPPIRYKVQIDEFIPAITATVVGGGSGYAVGEIITLTQPSFQGVPVGAPARLRVLTAPGGIVGTVEVISQIPHAVPPFGGSYFAAQTNPIAQAFSDGSGVGATFDLAYGPKGSQRVILTNQEFAILVYCRQVTDINLMDTLFQSAWINVLAAALCMVITGDKALANGLINQANKVIVEARQADGNEGLTVNDYNPDWIRVRGVGGGVGLGGFVDFDWGGLWPGF